MFAVVPAQQCLHPHQGVVAQAEFRLIVQTQQIVLHRPAQASLEIQPISQPAAHRRGVHGHRAAGARLGLVHGRVRVLQYGRDVGAVVGVDGHTDARRGIELESIVGDGILERGVAGFGDLGGERSGHVVPHQYDELIAAEAGDRNMSILGLKAAR